MKIKFWKGILLLTVVLFLCGAVYAAISIIVSGSWTFSIGVGNLQGATGSDLVSSYESATNQISITVGGSGGAEWRMDVKKTITTWHANLYLYVKKTNLGTSGKGHVHNDGETYQEVTDTNQSFFTGTGDRAGITVQEKLDGVSVAVPAATYSATVVFTVVQL